jgi:hypothetical protein
VRTRQSIILEGVEHQVIVGESLRSIRRDSFQTHAMRVRRTGGVRFGAGLQRAAEQPVDRLAVVRSVSGAAAALTGRGAAALRKVDGTEFQTAK